jgi:hypothetical protein
MVAQELGFIGGLELRKDMGNAIHVVQPIATASGKRDACCAPAAGRNWFWPIEFTPRTECGAGWSLRVG